MKETAWESDRQTDTNTVWRNVVRTNMVHIYCINKSHLGMGPYTFNEFNDLMNESA